MFIGNKLDNKVGGEVTSDMLFAYLPVVILQELLPREEEHFLRLGWIIIIPSDLGLFESRYNQQLVKAYNPFDKPYGNPFCFRTSSQTYS